MMKNVLADLALESEAATALALRLARAVDASENGGEHQAHEALIRRVLTPIAKFWVCKRGSAFAQEAMECLGGNGYVEEQGEGVDGAHLPRGAAELDLGGGRQHHGAGPAARAAHRAGGRCAGPRDGPVKGAHPALDAALSRLLHGLDAAAEEAQARRLARDTALLLQAALLRQHSSDAVFSAFCASRLQQGSDVFGTLPVGTDLDAIITPRNCIEGRI